MVRRIWTWFHSQVCVGRRNFENTFTVGLNDCTSLLLDDHCHVPFSVIKNKVCIFLLSNNDFLWFLIQRNEITWKKPNSHCENTINNTKDSNSSCSKTWISDIGLPTMTRIWIRHLFFIHWFVTILSHVSKRKFEW